MRHIWVKVPRGAGKTIFDLAKKHQGLNLLQFDGQEEERDVDVVVLNIANKKVSALFKDLESIENAEVTLFPQDVFPLYPPSTQVPEQIRQVTPRSPVEVWLNGLQSIGSWIGFLGYAVAASIIVWVGMYTNTAYLLVAAMLVAPYASPALNFAMATATGDKTLLWRNLLRYFVSLALTVLITAALSLVFQQGIASSIMIQVSEISSVAFLLPLAAGAVGAHNLSQSENNSFVPGAVTGALIAASLAPPAGLIGMAGALGRWDMAVNGLFLLVLQLVAINISGALVFRYYQMTPNGTRFDRGKPAVFRISLGASLLLFAGLLVWQFSSSPELQRSSLAQRAASTTQGIVESYPHAKLVEVNMRFTRPSQQDNNVLLGVIYVQPEPGTAQSDAQIEQALREQITAALLENSFNVEPLITVTVLQPPDN